MVAGRCCEANKGFVDAGSVAARLHKGREWPPRSPAHATRRLGNNMCVAWVVTCVTGRGHFLHEVLSAPVTRLLLIHHW